MVETAWALHLSIPVSFDMAFAPPVPADLRFVPKPNIIPSSKPSVPKILGASQDTRVGPFITHVTKADTKILEVKE
jgi:hypothetical protein